MPGRITSRIRMCQNCAHWKGKDVKSITILAAFAAVMCQSLGAQEPARQESKTGQFAPGQVWLDTNGKPIQAHGGGILARDKTYYWYGEDRTLRNQTNVSCYSSTDLYNWKHEGVAFAHEALSADIRDTTFIERPKVLFNPKTGKYVMWMHLEQRGYHFAQAGVAVSDQPAGPCTGPEAQLTFRSQSTCVLPVAGKPGAFLFMADRWMPRQLSDSRYIWLPFTIGPEGAVTIPWCDTWDLSCFDKR